MKKARHVLGKDLRRYAWLWGTFSALALLSVGMYGTDLGLNDSGWVRSLGFLTGTIYFLMGVVLVVLVVQEEPLGDPDAYWLTRPIPRRQVLLSKILFCVLVIAVVSAIADTLILVMNDGGARVPYALAGVFGWLPWILFQVFLSAQTRSLPRYLLLLVVLVFGSIVFQFLVLFAFPRGAEGLFSLGVLPGDLGAHHISLIQAGYWTAVFLGILFFLYGTRRTWGAWCCLVPAFFGALLLAPSDYRFITGESAIEVRLEGKALESSGTHSSEGLTSAVYSARVEIEEVPPDSDIWVSVQTVSLTADSGEIDVRHTGMSERARRVNRGSENSVYSVQLFTIPEDELLEFEGEGHLSVGLYVTASRQVEYDRIPLEDGASFTNAGNRVAVQGISRNEQELRVRLGAYIPGFFFEPQIPGEHMESLRGLYTFALVDTVTGSIYEGRNSSASFSMTARETARVDFSVPEHVDRENVDLIVYRREVLDSGFSFLNESGVTLER